MINELHVNLLGKLALLAIAATVVGKVTNVKLRGTKQEIDTISNAIVSSRRFQEEISKPGATVQSVMSKLGMKQMSAKEFERLLGIPFPM